MIQIGSVRNEYRARIWLYENKWWVAIETPNAVGGWYDISLGVEKSGFFGESRNIYALSYPDVDTAHREAQRLLQEHREYHTKSEAPKIARENAEIIG